MAKRRTQTTVVVPEASTDGPPRLGDKVKVVGHLFPHVERYIGREGTVDGSVPHLSCVVKLKGGDRKWFDHRELEVTRRKK